MAYDTTILNLILAGEFAQANALLASGHPNAFLTTVGATVERASPSGLALTVEVTDATPGAEHSRVVLSVLRAGVLAPVVRIDSTGKAEVNDGSGWKGIRILD